MNLVLIETTGNQAYIFATNKLRESVGASELTARVGTRFVLEAVNGIADVETILAISGKALLLVPSEEVGKQIVQKVTLRALKDAPGLEVRGVVSRSFDFARDELHPLIRGAHQQLATIRARLPGPSARFQRLPIIAECVSSGLPAAKVASKEDLLVADELREYSAQTFAKLSARKRWEERRDEILRRHGVSAKLPDATTDLEKLGCDWLAIVHADGNGLGQVFLNFDNVAQTNGNRDYVDKLRKFSIALDECTEKAFCRSLSVLRSRRDITPIVPLVLGGDDLTVVCDGRQALQFTKKFIECFEEETAKHEDVIRIMAGGVTSCAGVAIVKPHFPFFAGYQLAEELLKSAKTLKPQSAIDFHILYDASGSDHERIRRELTVDGGATRLVARPYLARHDVTHQGRTWDDLAHRVETVRARDDDDRRRLPNSMLHDLREGLFLGREAAEARLQLVRERYRPHINSILVDHNLFWREGQQHLTGLLDAIDAAEFWEGQP